jgi:hypothetical protein
MSLHEHEQEQEQTYEELVPENWSNIPLKQIIEEIVEKTELETRSKI